jgi:hypothetical protein
VVEKVLGKEKWKPAQSSTGLLYSACISRAGQLFPSQFKDFVGIKITGDLVYPSSLRRSGGVKRYPASGFVHVTGEWSFNLRYDNFHLGHRSIL